MSEKVHKVRLRYETYSPLIQGCFLEIEEQLINENRDGYLVGHILEKKINHVHQMPGVSIEYLGNEIQNSDLV